MRRSRAIGIATVLVATLLLAACQSLEAEQRESEPLDLLSLLNAAVLDWCDAQPGAVFYLPHISAPSCDTGEALYLGTLKGIFGRRFPRISRSCLTNRLRFSSIWVACGLNPTDS